MIALWMTLTAAAAELGLARVEILAESPGTFVNYDVPMIGTDHTRTAIRFVQQVQPVISLPVEGLHVGISISSQDVFYERRLPLADEMFSVRGGISTSLLVPRGVFAGAGAHVGPARIGLGVSALTPSGWGGVDYTRWTVLPTLGVGLGKRDPG